MHISITGLGRGGTSIMGHVFSVHPDVEYRHELSGRWLHQQFGIPWMGRTHPAYNVGHEIKAQQWARSGKLLVEKDPTHVLRMAYMRQLWPDAKFIYMIRDPRDLACSALKAMAKKGKTPETWLAERGEPMARSLEWLHPLVRIVAWWQHVVLTDIADMQGDHGITYVHYEDFLEAPQAYARMLFDWVGLEMHPRVEHFLQNVSDDPSVHVSHFSGGNFVPGHPRRVGRWRREWPQVLACAAWDHAGTTMEALGYGQG